jgi:hypothetical protein
MKRLTKTRRHQIYIKALGLVYIDDGLCITILRAVKKLYDGITELETDPIYKLFYPKQDNKKFLENYPELYKYKPDNKSAYWFDLDEEGYYQRIEILKKAIEDSK